MPRTRRRIGSDLIEGAVKPLNGKRLKQTGAGWRTASVAPIGNMVRADWAGDGPRYWSAQLAR